MKVSTLSDSMTSIKKAFNRSATKYPYTIVDLKKPQFYRRCMKRIKIALGAVTEKKTGRILDVGCGTAYFTYMLSKFYTQIVGIDLSENMIQIAKNSLKYSRMRGKIEFVIADGEYLPFKTNTFNVVLCLDFLHHVPDVASIIGEMVRAAIYGGKVIAIEPNFLNPFYVVFCLLVSEESLSKFIRASRRGLRTLFQESNMKDVAIREIDFIPLFFMKLTPFPNILFRLLEYLEKKFGRHPSFSFFSSHFTITGIK